MHAKKFFSGSSSDVWEVLDGKQTIKPTLASRYQSIYRALDLANYYDPVFVNDHAPGDPRRRFDYLQSLVVPYKCICYKYTGSRENLSFIWKVPKESC